MHFRNEIIQIHNAWQTVLRKTINTFKIINMFSTK